MLKSSSSHSRAGGNPETKCDPWIPACAGKTGLIRLLTAVGLIALGWLAVLPWIAEQPRMKSHLDWLEAEKIDPSAMYYTELEAMDDILHRQHTFSRDPAGERVTKRKRTTRQ